MADMISRAAAIEIIAAVKNITWSQSGKVLCGKMYSQIKDLPAVDAVPVVRCKDCKHGEPTKNGLGQAVIKCWQICELCGIPKLMEYDWFCADGERRESE